MHAPVRAAIVLADAAVPLVLVERLHRACCHRSHFLTSVPWRGHVTRADHSPTKRPRHLPFSAPARRNPLRSPALTPGDESRPRHGSAPETRLVPLACRRFANSVIGAVPGPRRVRAWPRWARGRRRQGERSCVGGKAFVVRRRGGGKRRSSKASRAKSAALIRIGSASASRSPGPPLDWLAWGRSGAGLQGPAQWWHRLSGRPRPGAGSPPAGSGSMRSTGSSRGDFGSAGGGGGGGGGGVRSGAKPASRGAHGGSLARHGTPRTSARGGRAVSSPPRWWRQENLLPVRSSLPGAGFLHRAESLQHGFSAGQGLFEGGVAGDEGVDADERQDALYGFLHACQA